MPKHRRMSWEVDEVSLPVLTAVNRGRGRC